MKKLTKLGIASISVFVLNTYTHTIVKADENRSSETSVTVELSTTEANAPQGWRLYSSYHHFGNY